QAGPRLDGLLSGYSILRQRSPVLRLIGVRASQCVLQGEGNCSAGVCIGSTYRHFCVLSAQRCRAHHSKDCQARVEKAAEPSHHTPPHRSVLTLMPPERVSLWHKCWLEMGHDGELGALLPAPSECQITEFSLVYGLSPTRRRFGEVLATLPIARIREMHGKGNHAQPRPDQNHPPGRAGA